MSGEPAPPSRGGSSGGLVTCWKTPHTGHPPGSAERQHANHVINGSTKITATVRSTGKAYPATVVGYDKTRDIALIQLQNASGLTTVPIGNSSSVMVGNAVVAMGNVEGRGTITAKPGQVTALNQTITASDDGGSIASETVTWVSPSGQRTTSSLHLTAGPPR